MVLIATQDRTQTELAVLQFPAEFDERFGELYALALKPALRIFADQTRAEDVAAETLARAWERWADLRAHPALGPWVARVATNLALDQVKRRAPVPLERAATDEFADLDRRLDLVPALWRLPRRQRQVVALRYFADLSSAEVAAVLGINIATARTHLRRALSALRGDLTSSQEDQ